MCSCIWLTPPRLAFSSYLRGRPSTNYYIWFNKVVNVVVVGEPVNNMFAGITFSFLQRDNTEKDCFNKFVILNSSRIASEFYPIKTSAGAPKYAEKLPDKCQGAI